MLKRFKSLAWAIILVWDALNSPSKSGIVLLFSHPTWPGCFRIPAACTALNIGSRYTSRSVPVRWRSNRPGRIWGNLCTVSIKRRQGERAFVINICQVSGSRGIPVTWSFVLLATLFIYSWSTRMYLLTGSCNVRERLALKDKSIAAACSRRRRMISFSTDIDLRIQPGLGEKDRSSCGHCCPAHCLPQSRTTASFMLLSFL